MFDFYILQYKDELTNSQQEIHNIQEKYLLHLESQQKLTASLQSEQKNFF